MDEQEIAQVIESQKNRPNVTNNGLRHGPGGVSKRTPQLRAAFVKLAGSGKNLTECCAILKVSRDFFCTWRKDDPTIEDDIEAALCETEDKYVEGILTQTQRARDFRGYAWLLEKLKPSRYGRRIVVANDRDIQVEATFVEASRGPKLDA